MDEANCRGLEPKDTEQFFPYVNDRHNGMSLATTRQVENTIQRFCLACPVRQDCLEYGVDTNSEGIFGGVLLTERIIRRGTKSGRLDRAMAYFNREQEKRQLATSSPIHRPVKR